MCVYIYMNVCKYVYFFIKRNIPHSGIAENLFDMEKAMNSFYFYEKKRIN